MSRYSDDAASLVIDDPCFNLAREHADFRRKHLSNGDFGSVPLQDMRCPESNFSASEVRPSLGSHSFSHSIWSEWERE